MTYRWDLLLPMLAVLTYSAIMFGFGYYEGKRNAEYKAEKRANLRRRLAAAREKQIYDWERDGI